MRSFMSIIALLAISALFSLHAEEVVIKKKLKEPTAVVEEVEEAEDEIAVLTQDEQEELELEQISEAR